MKQFFLKFLFIRKKLDVIDDEHVVFTVFFFKKAHFLVLERVHAVLAELFGCHVVHFLARTSGLDMIAYGLDQVRFAVPGGAMYKKRVIHYSRLFNNSLGCGMSQLIEWAYDESFKGIAWV